MFQLGKRNAQEVQAMQLEVTLEQRPVHVQVCELCVQIMAWNSDAPDQIIAICPECQKDLPG
jgi:hypothetical protein